MLVVTKYLRQAALVLLAGAGVCHAAMPPEEIYEKVSPSVLTLEVENSAKERFVGSAFLALRPGLAVTAWHVIHDASHVEAWFPDRRRVKVLGLVAKDEKRDIAVIAVETSDHPQTVLSPAAPRVGARAYVIGAPRGLDFSIADGLVSQIREVDGLRQYQLSCPISPGNSGGPVVNDRGEVIGVVSWRKTGVQSLSFAIPSLELSRLDAAREPSAWPARNTTANPMLDAPAVERSRAERDADGLNEFREALSASAGRTITVTLHDENTDRNFTFRVPANP